MSDADDRTATVAGILPYDLAGWPGFLVAPETDDESCARRQAWLEYLRAAGRR